jgi:excisionase family DNA binding protein
MEQKFVKFEEAIEKLGISADRLNQLREDGELRAYRDGASWKFRADEIDRLVTDGVPEPSPPSDINLVDSKDLVEATPLKSLDDLDELSLADDDLSLGGSELELTPDQEDTVTAGASDAALDIHGDTQEGSDPSDSILLSEEVLGESLHAPSTIIGRSEVEGSDLELVTEDEDIELAGSDVQLAAGASNVLSAGIAGSGVLDELEKESGNTSAFENLEELEIDLAGEASRILTPQDTAAAKGKQAQKKAPAEDSDLTLDDGTLAGEDEGTDPVPEALGSGTAKAKPAEGPTSDLELATDEDDFVLASEGGSDITLDSGDSGINLISPSDSGLALDDIPLEMGGSAILESLSLGDKGGGTSDLALVGSDDRLGQRDEPLASLQTDDDFRLTPLGDKDEDGDSSSQVIALDAGLDDLGGADVGMLGEDAFAEEEGVVVADDYSQVGDVGMAPAYAVAARADSDYSLMNILGLGSCFLLLLFAVVLMLDMVRNIWSWDANLALNDSLLDSLLGLFGLR